MNQADSGYRPTTAPASWHPLRQLYLFYEYTYLRLGGLASIYFTRYLQSSEAMLDHIFQRIFVTIPRFVCDLPRLGCIESTLAG